MPGGRPTKYTPALMATVCERLSKGEPMACLCRDEGMPDQSTVWRWAKANEEVSQALAHAREVGEEAIAADCLNIADDNGKDMRVLAEGVMVKDPDVVQRAKLRIETRLKLLAIWNPKKYGSKVDVTSGGDKIPVPIVQVLPLREDE